MHLYGSNLPWTPRNLNSNSLFGSVAPRLLLYLYPLEMRWQNALAMRDVPGFLRVVDVVVAAAAVAAVLVALVVAPWPLSLVVCGIAFP